MGNDNTWVEFRKEARELIARYKGDYRWSYSQWFRDRVDAAYASGKAKP